MIRPRRLKLVILHLAVILTPERELPGCPPLSRSSCHTPKAQIAKNNGDRQADRSLQSLTQHACACQFGAHFLDSPIL